MHVMPPLPQSYASFEQQSTNLVDDCRATHHPTLAHAMQRLQIQLLISLDRHETHRRSCDSLRDRLGIDVVALVRFHVRFHILRRYQSHLVSLFPQCSAKKMRTSARFHANQPDVYVASEAQHALIAHLRRFLLVPFRRSSDLPPPLPSRLPPQTPHHFPTTK